MENPTLPGIAAEVQEGRAPQPVKPQEPVSISPEGMYVVSGAALLSAMQILENEIPCKYIRTLDKVSGVLSSVSELQLKKPD